MVLSEPEGLLRIAIADLETAQASSDPAVFREGAWGFWLQHSPMTCAGCCCCWRPRGWPRPITSRWLN